LLLVQWGTDHSDLHGLQRIGRLRRTVQLRRKRVFGVRRPRLEAHDLLHMPREADGNVHVLALQRLRAVA